MAVLHLAGASWVFVVIFALRISAVAQTADARLGVPEPVAISGTTVAFVLGLLGLLLVVVVWTKLADLRLVRSAATTALQARITDAVRRDPVYGGVSVTTTIRVPLWRGSPVTIRIRGEVPTPELRDGIIRRVAQEVAGSRADYRIEDRLLIHSRRRSSAA